MVLDMGKPVRIVELAEELLRLHGLEPHRDLAIEFVGLRPGEKIFEEVLTAEEGTVATRHEKVFVASMKDPYTVAQVEEALSRFRSLVASSNGESVAVRQLLQEYVHWFIHPPSLEVVVPLTRALTLRTGDRNSS